MTRITKANVEAAFKALCKELGKRAATSWNDVGAWRLDHVASYGGYVIEEIINEHGAVDHPINSVRMKGNEFYDTVWFALRLLELKK